MSFEALDFYRIEDSLASEERIARDTVREFVDKEFLPVVVKHVRQDGSFPMELVPKLAELGLFGANLHGYGCAGMNNVAYGLVMQELERGDSGLRSFASVQGALCMYPIYSYGTEAQKERWLPAHGRGPRDRLLRPHRARLRLEPRRHADPAVRKGDRWILNGTKRWITNGTLADLAIVWAKTDDDIRGFLVETGMRGFEARDMKGKFSLRASVTSELFLSDVEVPEANRLPKVKGLKGPLACLTQARYGIAWGAIGAAHGLLRRGAALREGADRVRPARSARCRSRSRSSRSWLTEITKAQLLALQLGRLEGRRQAAPRDGVDGQAEQRRLRAADRAARARHARRQRHRRRLLRRCATW